MDGQLFDFAYSPSGSGVAPGQHGSLAIRYRGEANIVLRYQIFVENRDGHFVQWGETRDEILDNLEAAGSDPRSYLVQGFNDFFVDTMLFASPAPQIERNSI